MAHQAPIFDSPEDLLAHYGVKGMRWGVRKRNPLGSQTPASEKRINENKASKHDEHAAKAQKQIDEIKANPSKHALVQRSRNKRVKELEEFRDQNIKDAKAVREGKLTDRQKKVLIGSAIVGGLLAAKLASTYVDAGDANRSKILMKEKITGKKHEWKRNDKLKGDMDADELMANVVKQVNPGFGQMGTKMNCRRCTFAYEMRRRGYDVEATRSRHGTGQTPVGMMNALDPNSNISTGRISTITAIVKESMDETSDKPLSTMISERPWGANDISKDMTKMSPVERTTKIFEALSKEPDGSRGELGVKWNLGGGHSVAYEVVRGKPVIFDAQSGKSYRDPDELRSDFGEVLEAAGYTRLDNVNLNNDFLKRWLDDAR